MTRAAKRRAEAFSILLILVSTAAAAAAATFDVHLVRDINAVPKRPLDASPAPLVADGPLVYFGASTPETGRELWRTDGTPGGTALVADFRAGPFGFLDAYAVMARLDDALVFLANDGVHGPQLWRSDGTAAGMTRLTDIHPPAYGITPAQFGLTI